MIRNPIDITSRVSPELSVFIESIIERMESEEPLTLDAVRSFFAHEVPAEFDEGEEIHRFDVEESLVDELEILIDQFGESAAAEDFIQVYASEALSRAIEEVANDENRENPATLAAVQDALDAGLAARLVGEGILEEDEADMLSAELNGLIERFGQDATAEDFLRYE